MANENIVAKKLKVITKCFVLSPEICITVNDAIKYINVVEIELVAKNSIDGINTKVKPFINDFLLFQL